MPPPQKFTAPKPLDTLLETIRTNGWRLFTEKFEGGNDHINFDFHHEDDLYLIVYNTFNGRFIARKIQTQRLTDPTPEQTEFTEESRLDGTPWYDALLQFLYR